MRTNNNKPIIRTFTDKLNVEIVKGQLTTERMAKENAKRLMNAVEGWMESTMRQILPAEVFTKSKIPLYRDEVAEWLKTEGYHYAVENGGWSYVLKHKDQEISRLDFKKPE